MVQGNRKEVSLYEEAKAGLSSLIQQTATIFVGFVVMLLITGGAPSGFVVALSFCLGTAFVAWSEQNRIKKLTEPTQTIAPEISTNNAQRESTSKELPVSKDSKYTVTAEHIINTISDSTSGQSRTQVINTSGGSYYESINTGNYIQGNYINMSQDLTQAAVQIQELLERLQEHGVTVDFIQEQVARDMATQAQNSAAMKDKLVRWGQSLRDTAVSDPVKGVVKFALRLAGIPRH